MSDRCAECGATIDVDPKFHRCPPKWAVWRKEETEDNACIVYAHWPEHAASQWGEQDDNDSAEYSIAKGGEVEVYVRAEGSEDPPKLFAVTGEYEPVYSAREIPPE